MKDCIPKSIFTNKKSKKSKKLQRKNFYIQIGQIKGQVYIQIYIFICTQMLEYYIILYYP